MKIDKTTFMRKIFFIAVICFTTTLFIKCKKESSDIPIGTIKVNIGSTEKTFNVNAKATRLNGTNGYGIKVQGNYRSGSTTTLVFSIISPNPITNGTYTENVVSNPLVLMTHCVEVIWACVIQTSAYGSRSNPVTITITEITSTYVRGTFKGELQGSAIEVFSNGLFYVSF